jgi:hypothetical protein
MKVSWSILALSLASVCVAAVPADKCKSSDCLKLVQKHKGPKACKKYKPTTTTPKAVTVTSTKKGATKTVTDTTTVTDPTSTSTTTNLSTVTEFDTTITTTTTIQPAASRQAEKSVDLEARAKTTGLPPLPVPKAFKKACKNYSAYSSACSCSKFPPRSSSLRPALTES